MPMRLHQARIALRGISAIISLDRRHRIPRATAEELRGRIAAGYTRYKGKFVIGGHLMSFVIDDAGVHPLPCDPALRIREPAEWPPPPLVPPSAHPVKRHAGFFL